MVKLSPHLTAGFHGRPAVVPPLRGSATRASRWLAVSCSLWQRSASWRTQTLGFGAAVLTQPGPDQYSDHAGRAEHAGSGTGGTRGGARDRIGFGQVWVETESLQNHENHFF